ncbi:UNVERIFIED_CONTAM: Retrovirus-related Pol polyprotein from transposon TNT 1-94 [Sesamum radiatum]|uniref:Retrovirus-related Pol polyprotein from transposon TNT 1-94 n=1 Tax=Sesamum radiatum TaxID=300843 RepID=A0AAW2T715_SESRA
MISRESNLWYDAMKEEMNSMAFNEVWNLVELPDGFKAIGCKWVFKTKKDSLGNIERHKARLVAKGFTQREGIDYTETFSHVSKKDLLRTIMALVADFDTDLHQMDVKTAFLNGELEEEVYMKQPEGFSSSNGEHLGDKLHLNQCPRNDLEREQMKDIPYASAIGSLMYAQVCTRPDIAFAVGMLGRYQSNPGLDHWRAAKKVMRYLQGTKDYMLMYRRTENLEVVGTQIQTLLVVLIRENPHLVISL